MTIIILGGVFLIGVYFGYLIASSNYSSDVQNDIFKIITDENIKALNLQYKLYDESLPHPTKSANVVDENEGKSGS